MKNFATGLLLATLLLGGYTATAGDQGQGEDAGDASVARKSRYNDLLRAANDLAARIAYERHELAEQDWEEKKAKLEGRKPPKRGGAMQFVNRVTLLEWQLMSARTELAAKYFLEKLARNTVNYEAAIGMPPAK